MSLLKKASTAAFYALPAGLQKSVRLLYLKARGRRNLAEARRVAAPLPPPTNDRKILFVSLRFWPVHHAWETTLAAGLRGRGHPVEFLACDQCFTECDYRAGGKMPAAACGVCWDHSRRFLETLGFSVRTAGTYVGHPDGAPPKNLSIADCRAVQIDGLPVGELCYQSICRHLLVGTVTDTPEHRAVYNRFLEGAARLVRGIGALLDEPWHALVMVNGKFFAERLIFELARRRGLDVLTYERGRLQDSLVFAWNAFANDGVQDAAWDAVKDRPLTPEQDRELDQYLEDRVYGRRSMADPWNLKIRGEEEIRKAAGLDPSKPLFVLFTNLLWDTSVLEKDLGFKSHADWILRTVDWFRGRPDLQLVIRVHPAEARLKTMLTQERVQDILPPLPPNVVLIPATSDLSSYTLMDMAKAVLVYATNAGMEAVLRGTPALCAAKAHYHGKGVALDVATADDYFGLLSRWTDLKADRQAARRYAHFFFFRYMMPFPAVEEFFRGDVAGRDFRYTFDRLDAPRSPDVEHLVAAISAKRPIYRGAE